MSTSTTTIGLLAPLCLVFLMGQSTVYRCVDPVTNMTKFSDTRCQAHEQGSSRTVRPNSIDTQRSRMQRQVVEDERLRAEAEQQQGLMSVYEVEQQANRQLKGDNRCALEERAYQEAKRSKARPSTMQHYKARVQAACGRDPEGSSPRHFEQSDRSGAADQDDERRRGPVVITNCDQGGCWDTRGERYNRGNGGTHFGPNGVVCQMMGGQMICP